MAQRRMFSHDIVASDAFLEMPTSSRELYFQLGMYADDDGFVNPKKIMRMIGASEDDLKVLLAKRFLLTFENGVVVIKHWLIHNMIRKDRYKETMYVDQKKRLIIKENKAYTELGQPNGNQPAPQVRLGKVRLGKVRELNSADASASRDIVEIIDLFAPINTAYGKWFKNTTQRNAVKNLLKQFPRPQLDNIIKLLPTTNASVYAPTITTPLQLEDNMARLKAFVQKERNRGQLKGKEIIGL